MTVGLSGGRCGLRGLGFIGFWVLGTTRDDCSRINPGIRIIKGTIFKEQMFGKIRRPRLISIRWNFVWEKGLDFKDFLGDQS